MEYEEMEEMLENISKNVNGRDFWKVQVLDLILCDEDVYYNLTKQDLEKVVDRLMDNDYMWNTIYEEISSTISDYRERV